MKKTERKIAKMFSLLAIIALAAVIGFSLVSCGGDDDGGGGGGLTVNSTNGKLTITGIDAKYNGKYIGAQCYGEDDSFLIGYVDINSNFIAKLAKIEGGNAELKVWKVNQTSETSGSADNFTGSGSYDCAFGIMEVESVSNDGEGTPVHAFVEIAVTFTDGTGIADLSSADWEE